MAATHTDGFPTTSAEKCLDYGVENLKKESEPSNLTDSAPCNDVTAESGHDQQAKYRLLHHLTLKTIGVLFAVVAAIVVFSVLVAVVTVLGIYVYHLQAELQVVTHRLDSLETQCNNRCISVTDGSGLDVQLSDSDHELLLNVDKRLFQLDIEIQANVSTLWQAITLMHEMYANDTLQARLNASIMQTQIDSLNNSLLSLANKTISNMTQLKKFIETETQRMHNLSLMVARSVSVLADWVTMSESTLHELEANVTDLGVTLRMKLEIIVEDFSIQLAKLAMNISSNEKFLRDLLSTQVDLAASILGLHVNLSTFEDHTGEQLKYINETFTSTLSAVEHHVSQIEASHTAQLQNLSLVRDALYNELMITQDMFLANTSTLEHSIAELGKDIAHTNELLKNLTSNHEELHYDLAVSKEVFSGNLSALEQGWVQLLANLTDTNDELRTEKENLLVIISTTKQELKGQINDTQDQVQSISSRQTELHLNIIAMEETLVANVSTLQSGLKDIDDDLTLTVSHVRNLSSLFGDFQMDIVTTRASIQQNMSYLHSRIRNVEHNHSLLLSHHSRALRAMEMNASVLTRKVVSVSQMLTAQGQKITLINSTVSDIDNRLTSVSRTLSSQIEQRAGQLGTRIDDHIDWIQRLFSEQSLTLDRYGDRIHHVEQKLSGACILQFTTWTCHFNHHFMLCSICCCVNLLFIINFFWLQICIFSCQNTLYNIIIIRSKCHIIRSIIIIAM